MHSSNNCSAAILDSLSEGVVTINRDFRIDFFNLAAEKITGFKREEVFGKSCQKVFHYAYCETECPIAHVLKTGQDLFDLDSRLINRNGKNIPIRLNATILRDEKEKPVGGVISFRPVVREEVLPADGETHSFFGMIGKGKGMRELFEMISEISYSDATVLIQGETGTGKEMVASAIHMTNSRRESPLVKVNCSVLPSQLLASELFGHVKGAFTDAKHDRTGRFELAHKGTIFLDEIADVPLEVQAQLLRVLQDGTFERLGESETRKVDVRVIAATNVNLGNAIRNGKFREDLYYRLNVIPIQILPLRERNEDLLHLARHFIRKYAPRYQKNICDIEEDAFQVLMKHRWPGNVRELENVIEFACIHSKKNRSLTLDSLPPHLRELQDGVNNANLLQISEMKAGQLISLLERHNWNQTEVARQLGVNRTTVWRNIKRLGIR